MDAIVGEEDGSAGTHSDVQTAGIEDVVERLRDPGVNAGPVLSDLVDGDDVGMLESGGGLGLGLEADDE